MTSKSDENQRLRRLTRPAHELLGTRLRDESGFVGNLLSEAVNSMLRNEAVVAQLLLRDITNCTVGFPALARETGLKEKSLMRMLSAKGNPQARNLFLIMDALQRLNGLELQVQAV